MTEPSSVSTEFLERRINDLKGHDPIDPPSGPPHDGDMDDEWRKKVDERLGALEKTLEKVGGTVEGLRMAASMVSIGFALLSALTFYTLTRVDGLSTKVEGLSGKLSDEFRALRSDMKTDGAALRSDLTATTAAIANAVTAAKQVPPQVLLVPTPQIQSPQPEQKP